MGFHRFIQAALSRKTIKIFGDGRQSRDFTFVADIVAANLQAAERGMAGGIYNLGGGSRIMLRDALKILEGELGLKMKLKFEKSALGDVERTAADTTRARREFGFQPGARLAEGLSTQIAWHRKMREEGLLP